MKTIKFIFAELFRNEIKTITDWVNSIMKDDLTLSNLVFYTLGAMIYVITRLMVITAISIIVLFAVYCGTVRPFIFVPIYILIICPMLVVFGIMCRKSYKMTKENSMRVKALKEANRKTKHSKKK